MKKKNVQDQMVDELCNRVANVLRHLEDQGLNTAEIYRTLGIAKGTLVSYRDRQAKDVKGSVLAALCRHYNVDPHWLVLGDGPGMFAEAQEPPDRITDPFDFNGHRSTASIKARLRISARHAEIQHLKKVSPNDPPEEATRKLRFSEQMAERFAEFEKRLLSDFSEDGQPKELIQ